MQSAARASSANRGLSRGALLLASLLLNGCLTESTHIETGREHTVGYVTGDAVDTPPIPLVAVHKVQGGATATVAEVSSCRSWELRAAERTQVREKRVTAGTTTIALIWVASGFLLFFLPDQRVSESVAPGLALVAAGTVLYGLPGVQQSTQRTELAPSESREPGPVVRCKLRVLPHRRLELSGSQGTVEGTSDAQGLVVFDRAIVGPFEALIDGTPAAVEEIE